MNVPTPIFTPDYQDGDYTITSACGRLEGTAVLCRDRSHGGAWTYDVALCYTAENGHTWAHRTAVLNLPPGSREEHVRSAQNAATELVRRLMEDAARSTGPAAPNPTNEALLNAITEIATAVHAPATERTELIQRAITLLGGTP